MVACHLTHRALKISLLSLTASTLFGLFQKSLSIQVLSFCAMWREVERLVSPILAEHEKDEEDISAAAREAGLALDVDIDWDRVGREFTSSVPWYARRRALATFKQSAEDLVAGHRRFTRKYFHQCTMAWLQLLALVLFVLCVALGVKAI
jgi:hypothetical protein